jgi:cell wall-associated NlpC family hydrolase
LTGIDLPSTSNSPIKTKTQEILLMKFRKFVFFVVCAVFLATNVVVSAAAQSRDRVIRLISSQPVNQPDTTSSVPSKTKPLTSSLPVNRSESRPVLTNDIQIQKPLVQKTGSSSPVNMMAAAAARASSYGAGVSGQMMQAISSRLGIPYHYGSTGPNRYDCSGFVWSVFQDAGFFFERSSARTMWENFEPVTGDDRFKFGTLVFFNSLGHVGIVADAEGFYQASSSKGITYSKFEGYWEKRIVGYRRVPLTLAASSK